MNQLNFLASWGAKRERAWSGTYLSIFNALQAHFSIKDYALKGKTFEKILEKLHLQILPMNIGQILLNRFLLSNVRGKTFQFGEFLTDTPTRNTFIYHDLTVDYMMRLRKTSPEIFSYAGFGKLSIQDIEKRLSMQNKYYETASGILTMGKWIADDLKTAHPELSHKIHHVGGGINLDVKQIKSQRIPGSKKILFVGRAFKRKGGDIVIDAFRLLREKWSDVELHIAGPHQSPIDIGEPGYFYYGDASRDVLQNLMNQCDVFCMPSRFEAYGLVFIEALAFGLPCVGRNAFEMPNFIEKGITGELVNSDDPKELADKLEKVLVEKHYKEVAENNRSYYLEEYSWDKVAARIANVINSIN